MAPCVRNAVAVFLLSILANGAQECGDADCEFNVQLLQQDVTIQKDFSPAVAKQTHETAATSVKVASLAEQATVASTQFNKMISKASSTTWLLVRRAPASGWWPSATDQLAGTSVYGTPTTDTTADVDFSIAFSEYSFTKYRIATGDEQYWVEFSKDVLARNFANKPRQVLSSSENAEPHTTSGVWYNRGTNTDPLISVAGWSGSSSCTAASPQSCWIYVGNAHRRNNPDLSWQNLASLHGGVNVFIDACADCSALSRASTETDDGSFCYKLDDMLSTNPNVCDGYWSRARNQATSYPCVYADAASSNTGVERCQSGTLPCCEDSAN